MLEICGDVSSKHEVTSFFLKDGFPLKIRLEDIRDLVTISIMYISEIK